MRSRLELPKGEEIVFSQSLLQLRERTRPMARLTMMKAPVEAPKKWTENSMEFLHLQLSKLGRFQAVKC
ncbi:hypothetical protein ACE6H2_007518 [Prunus campanulata]